jgi:3-hydroxy-9,10-secoandrosta-1,3,5(10)-triene-9,17-dione monooxygenase reductase component
MSKSSPRVDDYKAAIGAFPTGVAVVTAVGNEGPAGLTTNAITSLSLDPLLLLVCFANDSRTLPVVQEAGRFAVNLLCSDQSDLAHVFASKRLQREKFEAVTHTVEHGVPVLDDALAWFVCDVDANHPGGDHTIIVGRVTALRHNTAAEPLRYEQGEFA